MQATLNPAQHGKKPIKVLLLTSTSQIEKIKSWVFEAINKFGNLEVLVSTQKNIENVESLVKNTGRPFVVLVDLTHEGRVIGGSGHRWKDILEESLGKITDALEMDDELSLWYLSNYELSTLRLGKDRPKLFEELERVLSYLNGR